MFSWFPRADCRNRKQHEVAKMEAIVPGNINFIIFMTNRPLSVWEVTERWHNKTPRDRPSICLSTWDNYWKLLEHIGGRRNATERRIALARRRPPAKVARQVCHRSCHGGESLGERWETGKMPSWCPGETFYFGKIEHWEWAALIWYWRVNFCLLVVVIPSLQRIQ